MNFLLIILVFVASVRAAPSNASTPPASDKFIVTTKVTPAYWRATFSGAPLNIEGASFLEDYYALIGQLAADSDVKVVVFDSSSPYFWLNHFDILNNIPAELTLDSYWGNVTKLANLPVLTVAAIQGYTSGGGAEIAMTLDVRFGSKEKAVYVQPEVGIGVVPGGGGMELLPRLVGRSRALEIVIEAGSMDAERAAAYGWLNRAIPDAQFTDFVDKFARRVASWDKDAISAAKAIINKRAGFPTADEWTESFTAFGTLFSNPLVGGRVAALKQAGLQTNLTFELDAAKELLEFSGPPPYPHAP